VKVIFLELLSSEHAGRCIFAKKSVVRSWNGNIVYDADFQDPKKYKHDIVPGTGGPVYHV
jgi:hypothetical protein